ARVRLFNLQFPKDKSQRGHFRLDEIWKEIESVEKPHTPLVQWDRILKAPAPSAEVAAIQTRSMKRLAASFGISIIAGAAIPLLTDFPIAFMLLIWAGFIACAISRTWQTWAGDSLLKKIQARHRSAKEEAQRLQEQYNCVAGIERLGAKHDELLNQK